MNAKRLLKLADYLQTVPAKRFDMGIWADGAFCDRKGDEREHTCGTTACAMGWATAVPEFKRAGLTLSWSMVTAGPSPRYRKWRGLEAAEAFFDISEDHAKWLFGSADPRNPWDERHETPKQAALRIRRFVKSGGRVPRGRSRFESPW